MHCATTVVNGCKVGTIGGWYLRWTHVAFRAVFVEGPHVSLTHWAKPRRKERSTSVLGDQSALDYSDSSCEQLKCDIRSKDQLVNILQYIYLLAYWDCLIVSLLWESCNYKFRTMINTIFWRANAPFSCITKRLYPDTHSGEFSSMNFTVNTLPLNLLQLNIHMEPIVLVFNKYCRWVSVHFQLNFVTVWLECESPTDILSKTIRSSVTKQNTKFMWLDCFQRWERGMPFE